MRRAIVLGLLQGPTEMAPVSSSAHTALLARLLTDARHEDPAFAKSFEVALHAGTAMALAAEMRADLGASLLCVCAHKPPGRRGRGALSWLALSALPPVLAGYLFERPIERRLAAPPAIAAGLLIGAAAMALADRRPGTRRIEQTWAGDALGLGLAQAAALAPGVSRRGATLAAARAQGFTRTDADKLSWLAGIPVIIAASTLKGLRLLHGEAVAPAQRARLLAGASASFASTLLSVRLARRMRLAAAPLAPFCLYRVLLAALSITFLRGDRNSQPTKPTLKGRLSQKISSPRRPLPALVRPKLTATGMHRASSR